MEMATTERRSRSDRRVTAAVCDAIISASAAYGLLPPLALARSRPPTTRSSTKSRNQNRNKPIAIAYDLTVARFVVPIAWSLHAPIKDVVFVAALRPFQGSWPREKYMRTKVRDLRSSQRACSIENVSVAQGCSAYSTYRFPDGY
jgi:hypothetical protein